MSASLLQPAPRRAMRRGLSLVECMISLAIAATLLTACGMAFSASSKAVQMNDEFFRATQAARVTVARISKQVRLAEAVDERDVATGNIFLDNTTVTQFHLYTSGTTPQDVIYKYDAADKTVKMLVKESPTTTNTYVLCRNVSDAKFVIAMGEDANKAKCVARVSIALTVKVGQNTVRLSGSAAPRRNLSY